MSTTTGRRLKRLREARDFSQGQLATYSGVARSYISEIESGQAANVSGARLSKLAEVLETSVDYLLGQTDDPRATDRPPVGQLTHQEEEMLKLFQSMDDARRQIALATLRAQAQLVPC